MSAPAPRVLVIRGGAIGDFILTLPVLSALRRQFPQIHLELLGYPHIANLALAGGLIDALHPIEARSMAAMFVPLSQLPRELADYFASFSLIISYLYDPDRVFAINVTRCSQAQYITGPHRPDEHADLHATLTFLKPLERLAIFDADPTPELPRLRAQPADPDTAPADPTTDPAAPVLAVHPGSGSEEKNWPEVAWAELLAKLADTTRWDLLLVGGEAEGDRLTRLARCWPRARQRLARSLPLVDLARELARSHLFVGHDSGITHLAAALGLPGIALWSHTNPRIWAPRSSQLTPLIGPGPLAALPVEPVFNAVSAAMAKSARIPGYRTTAR